MLLDEQSAVNCTLHIERVAFRCCLAAAGTWVDDSTCAFREAASSPGHPSNMMAKRLADWNKCLATESAGNDTLTDLIAAAGQVCFAAPGSTTEAQIALVSVLIVLGVLVALVVAVVAFCTCCVRSGKCASGVCAEGQMGGATRGRETRRPPSRPAARRTSSWRARRSSPPSTRSGATTTGARIMTGGVAWAMLARCRRAACCCCTEGTGIAVVQMCAADCELTTAH